MKLRVRRRLSIANCIRNPMHENWLIFLELSHDSLKRRFPHSSRKLLALTLFGRSADVKYGINFINEMKSASNDFFLDNCVGDIIDTDDIEWYLLLMKHNVHDTTEIDMINESNTNYSVITIGLVFFF